MTTTKRTPILTDAEWLILKAARDEIRAKVGRPCANERRTFEAVVWRFRNDARWREIPPDLGPWWRAAQLHYRWQKTQVWERLHALLREADQAALVEIVAAMIEPPAEEGTELDEESLARIPAGALFGGFFSVPREGRFVG